MRLLAFLVVAICFLSCEGNFKDVQRMGQTEFAPSGEAHDFELKYTDSGRITSILKSPLMRDFNQLAHPYTEFPKGVSVTMYEKTGKRTFITAKYGINYKGTTVIELKDSVRITNEAGQRFASEQLFFDQKNDWFYTDQAFRYTDSRGTSTGTGVDFNKDFTIINSQKISGEFSEGAAN